MKATRYLVISLVIVWLCAASAGFADLSIGAPGLAPSTVDAAGGLHEDWGVVTLRLMEPEGTPVVDQRSQPSPLPTIARNVTTNIAVGPILLTSTAYRAPIWPRGVDVLAARVDNDGAAESRVRFQVLLPEQVKVGQRLAVLGGRQVLALPKEPQPVRLERSWGYLAGGVPMPGWGRPEVECDPAFRNIRAGMGGVRIIYRFAVPPGAKRTVILGLCESHHVEAGQRRLLLYVEGAPRIEVDPIAAWGRHVPRCLRFNARDADGDGRLQVVVGPHQQARDRNPILNVIWVFAPDLNVDLNEVLRGEWLGPSGRHPGRRPRDLSAAAEYYVDVGGEKDQSLYEEGALIYDLTLAPGAQQELLFLVAPPDAAVPNPERMAWTAESLKQAADDVWRDWGARNARRTQSSEPTSAMARSERPPSRPQA